ncbi:F510_1955 family glycosylhydrolase [Streptomyces sp. NPDC052236]|uniref:F510_1955 family glycosylhydrolase n=1 Tax=Streptomyces sp. NPDC052236 TaxID=3365686 RepID=UPI0037CFBDF4
MNARPLRRPLFAATSTAIAVLLLGACAGGSSDEPAASEALTHVHGLGVGPADGRVYVATHDGLYTLGKDKQPQRVGDRKDDFMGFTVTDEGAFLASGHGAPGSDRPGNLGLIESKDAGGSWTSRSLSGQADFHSLESARGTVYGYEGGRVRATRDLATWEDRAVLDALDLAADPAKDGRLLATTATGVVASADGGVTFGKATGPVQAYLSWPAQGALFGIDPSGKLRHSANGGTTWEDLSTVPGTPRALTAVDAERILVATASGDGSESGVYESRDGGRTFTQLTAAAS